MCFVFRYDEEGIAKISSRSIRPRARTMIDYEDVTVGDIVMVNYNCDEPKQRGYWYDMVVKNKVIWTIQSFEWNIIWCGVMQ